MRLHILNENAQISLTFYVTSWFWFCWSFLDTYIKDCLIEWLQELEHIFGTKVKKIEEIESRLWWNMIWFLVVLFHIYFILLKLPTYLNLWFKHCLNKLSQIKPQTYAKPLTRIIWFQYSRDIQTNLFLSHSSTSPFLHKIYVSSINHNIKWIENWCSG